MNAKILCSCKNLAKAYGRHTVLEDCSLTVTSGELAGLVGENGSGKSTLIRCLLGFTRPSGGIVEVSGKVGYCPQEDYLNPAYTVDEHLSLACAIYGRHDHMDMTYVNALTDRLRLDEYRKRPVKDLSEGTRQKLKFLTSIIHKPTLLLMDEPYGGFDWNMYLVFWDLIGELCETGAGVLLITHLIYDRHHFNRIYELQGGRFDA